ncbi:MAG: hypothetical protein P0S93_05650 [Candidatus Neptunochlamydia sp.]|nr:hypothetical protein [Candidatus Neptunochlamydia sp.]
MTISSLLDVHDDLENPDFLNEYQSFIERMVEKKARAFTPATP